MFNILATTLTSMALRQIGAASALLIIVICAVFELKPRLSRRIIVTLSIVALISLMLLGYVVSQLSKVAAA